MGVPQLGRSHPVSFTFNRVE